MSTLKILGASGVISVADTPAGVRKGALIIAATATRMFVLRRRFSTHAAVRETVEAVRNAGRIQLSHWVETSPAIYALTHSFVIKGTTDEIPGTGPSPADLGPKATAALTLSDDIRLGCSVMKGGYALMPQLNDPEPEPAPDHIDEALAEPF